MFTHPSLVDSEPSLPNPEGMQPAENNPKKSPLLGDFPSKQKLYNFIDIIKY